MIELAPVADKPIETEATEAEPTRDVELPQAELPQDTRSSISDATPAVEIEPRSTLRAPVMAKRIVPVRVGGSSQQESRSSESQPVTRGVREAVDVKPFQLEGRMAPGPARQRNVLRIRSTTSTPPSRQTASPTTDAKATNAGSASGDKPASTASSPKSKRSLSSRISEQKSSSSKRKKTSATSS